MELILLRHGTVSGNLERRFIGVTDQPLTPQGEALARRVAPSLPAVEQVYLSPLARCVQTAQLLWPNAPKRVIKSLRETDFGPFEGKSHQELQDDPLYLQWLATGGRDFTPAGIEPPDHVARRVAGAFCYLARDAGAQGFQRIGAVTHGGVIAALLTRFGLPPRDYFRWLPPNCGGYRCQLSAHPLKLQVLEDLTP